MSELNLYENAINAIETTSKHYKVKFEIHYGTNGNAANAEGISKFWRIRVMGKLFKNNDFIASCQEAISFVYYSHENQP